MLQRQDQLVRLLAGVGPLSKPFDDLRLLRSMVGRFRHPLPVEESQAEDQRHAAARDDGADFVHAVGIESGEAQLRRLFGVLVEHHLAAEMPDHQLATAMNRGQHQHHRREHAGYLLGIAVVDEEGAGVVDEELVEIGRDRPIHAEAKGDVDDQLVESLLPATPADPDLAGIDLPGSPDVTVDERFLAAPVWCAFGDPDQLLDLRRLQRKGDSADTFDVDRRHDDFALAADAEITRLSDRSKQGEESGTDRGHGDSGQAGRWLVDDSPSSMVEAFGTYPQRDRCLSPNVPRDRGAWWIVRERS